MALKAEQSLNARAEARTLVAWASWPNGKSPAGYFPLPMTEAAAAFFKDQGFLVIENALTTEEIAEMRRETAAICKGERGDVSGFIEGAPGESDDDAMRRYLCIHFPHKISPIMEREIAHPAIVEVLTKIISPNVKCMQSMLFVKAAGKPGQPWHQDEIYIPTRDRSLTGAWLALDDATVENGCLWVIPASQGPGILYMLEEHNDRRFDCGAEARGFPYTNDQAVPVEVKAGSIVFFNGYLLHRSLPNYANAGYRRSLVNHYMSAESFLPWFGNKLPEGDYVAISDHRDIIMIAGKDPYAYKGTESRNSPHVRPSGEGGCGGDGAAKTKKAKRS
ncbi:MAG: phytanoyl-CoA dioxygenase family protein [Fimbriimonadaceae bacterium]